MQRTWMVLAGLTGMGAVAGWSAVAQERLVITGNATSLAEQQRALKDAKAQAATARRLSEEIEAKAAKAQADADRLSARASALAARIQESEADIRAGQARIAIINRLIANQSSRLASQQEPLVRLTAALQSFSRRPPVLALLQPGSLADTIHVRAAFGHVLPVIQERTAALRADLQQSRRLQAMAVQADASLKTSREKLARQQSSLRRLEAEKRLAARGLTSDATVEAERAMAMGERARDIGELMDQLEAAGDVRDRLSSLPGPLLRPARPGDVAAPKPPPGPSERSGGDTTPPYRLPVIGAIITGMGELSESGVRARGITIATQAGAQLVAPADGRIAFAGPYRGFGQIIIIDHGGGWSTLLTDLGRLSVEVGQDVRQGAPVGTARNGSSPAVTIELRRQGRPVDILAMTNARK